MDRRYYNIIIELTTFNEISKYICCSRAIVFQFLPSQYFNFFRNIRHCNFSILLITIMNEYFLNEFHTHTYLFLPRSRLTNMKSDMFSRKQIWKINLWYFRNPYSFEFFWFWLQTWSKNLPYTFFLQNIMSIVSCYEITHVSCADRHVD